MKKIKLLLVLLTALTTMVGCSTTTKTAIKELKANTTPSVSESATSEATLLSIGNNVKKYFVKVTDNGATKEYLVIFTYTDNTYSTIAEYVYVEI